MRLDPSSGFVASMPEHAKNVGSKRNASWADFQQSTHTTSLHARGRSGEQVAVSVEHLQDLRSAGLPLHFDDGRDASS